MGVMRASNVFFFPLSFSYTPSVLFNFFMTFVYKRFISYDSLFLATGPTVSWLDWLQGC